MCRVCSEVVVGRNGRGVGVGVLEAMVSLRVVMGVRRGHVIQVELGEIFFRLAQVAVVRASAEIIPVGKEN